MENSPLSKMKATTIKQQDDSMIEHQKPSHMAHSSVVSILSDSQRHALVNGAIDKSCDGDFELEAPYDSANAGIVGTE